MAQYPHTVTIYNRLGVAERKEAWSRFVLHGIRVETRRGSTRMVGGDGSLDSVRVYIPGCPDGYVQPDAFEGKGWTLRERDVIVEGESDTVEPSGMQHPITYVDVFYRGTDRIHHFEAGGK